MKPVRSYNPGARISDHYTYKGMQIIIVENEHIKLTFIPDKGADIVEFIIKALNLDFLWKTPMGLRDITKFIPPGTGNTGNFIDLYEGGWQTIFPNGGTACDYKGAKLGMNGEVCNLPWSYRIIETGPERVKVVFETQTYQTPFRICKTVTLRQGRVWVDISETIRNEGQETLDYMWGNHVAFDAAFLRDGRWGIDIPCKRIETNTTAIEKKEGSTPGNRVNRFPENGVFHWPYAEDIHGERLNLSNLAKEETRTCDILYLSELDSGWFAIMNRQDKFGFALTWPESVFPYVWFWQNFGGSYEYPWYGRGNCIALEPFTSYPSLGLNEAIKRGNHRALSPGQKVTAELKAGVVYDCDKVGDLRENWQLS